MVRFEFSQGLLKQRPRPVLVALLEMVEGGGDLNDPMVQEPVTFGRGPPDIFQILMAFEEESRVEEQSASPKRRRGRRLASCAVQRLQRPAQPLHLADEVRLMGLIFGGQAYMAV